MKYFIKTRQSPIAKFSRCYGQLAPVTAVYLEQKAKNIGKELAPTSLGKKRNEKILGVEKIFLRERHTK